MTDKKPTLLQIFPTSIFYVEDVLTSDEFDLIYKRLVDIKNNVASKADNWLTKDVYTTHDSLNLCSLQIPEIKTLIDKVSFYVNAFNNINGSDHEYTCSSSWLNYYSKNQYQEYHNHAGNTYSAVFYSKVDENSSPLIFENPIATIDMLPPKSIVEENDRNYMTWVQPAKENSLIIFRSWLKHMVPLNNSNERISVSFNF